MSLFIELLIIPLWDQLDLSINLEGATADPSPLPPRLSPDAQLLYYEKITVSCCGDQFNATLPKAQVLILRI